MFFLFSFNLAPPTSQSHVITQLSMPQNLSILQQQGAAQLVTNQVINGQSLVGSHIVTTTLSNSQASSPSITSPTSADSPGGHGTGIKHFLWFWGTCLWMHCCKYLLHYWLGRMDTVYCYRLQIGSYQLIDRPLSCIPYCVCCKVNVQSNLILG